LGEVELPGNLPVVGVVTELGVAEPLGELGGVLGLDQPQVVDPGRGDRRRRPCGVKILALNRAAIFDTVEPCLRARVLSMEVSMTQRSR